MTTYRLWPATSGPGTAVAWGGNFLSGLVFTVAAGTWFTGYWWWVCGSGQATAPVKCALWTTGGAGSAPAASYVVPGSVVTTGTLTAGQWNYIPMPAPLPLGPDAPPLPTQVHDFPGL